MATKNVVSDDQMNGIVGKCLEIQRLARLDGGCPWEPDAMNAALQAIVEGRFPGAKGASQTAQASKSALLGLTGIVPREAQELFNAADFFREKGQPDGITFWLGDNFKKNFAGKVEIDVAAAELRVYNLRSASVDGPVLTALGGNDRAKTSLAYVAQLIKAQPKGESGILLTNGWANVFYVEDDNGVLWAVCCYWFSGDREWRVFALPVTNPYWWYADIQVFSPAVLES